MKLEVSKKEFKAYESVRQSGTYNMITEAYQAARACKLSINRYVLVQKQYTCALNKWPEVRKGE